MILQDFYKKHEGETIFIIGSGKSLDFYDKRMFEHVTTIGVNFAYKHFNINYNIIHHHSILSECVQDISKTNTKLFVSEYDCGVIDEKFKDNTINKNYITYKHNNQTYQKIEHDIFEYIKGDSLYMGGTTTVNAISLAVYMGAKNIILVGCDAGSINGEPNFEGYYTEKHSTERQHYHSVRTVELIKKIRKILNSQDIYLSSLSPFLDYNLEGNTYNFTL